MHCGEGASPGRTWGGCLCTLGGRGPSPPSWALSVRGECGCQPTFPWTDFGAALWPPQLGRNVDAFAATGGVSGGSCQGERVPGNGVQGRVLCGPGGQPPVEGQLTGDRSQLRGHPSRDSFSQGRAAVFAAPGMPTDPSPILTQSLLPAATRAYVPPFLHFPDGNGEREAVCLVLVNGRPRIQTQICTQPHKAVRELPPHPGCLHLRGATGELSSKVSELPSQHPHAVRPPLLAGDGQERRVRHCRSPGAGRAPAPGLHPVVPPHVLSNQFQYGPFAGRET